MTHKALLMLFGMSLFACDNARPSGRQPSSVWKRDSVDIPAGSFMGKRLFCDVPANGFVPPHDSDDLVNLHTSAYGIDRTTVDCNNYHECVNAGRCEPLGLPRENWDDEHFRRWKIGCIEGHAWVNRGAAAAYCAFRGGRVQSADEWQRAVRGTSGRRYPPGMSFEIPLSECPNPTRAKDVHSWRRRCVYTSEEGVVFTRADPADWEFTRDKDCWDPLTRGEPEKRQGGIPLGSEQLDPAVTHEGRLGLIRCTYTETDR